MQVFRVDHEISWDLVQNGFDVRHEAGTIGRCRCSSETVLGFDGLVLHPNYLGVRQGQTNWSFGKPTALEMRLRLSDFACPNFSVAIGW